LIPDPPKADFNQPQFEDGLPLSAGAQKDDLVFDHLGLTQELVSNPKGIAFGAGDESHLLLNQGGKKLEIIEAAIQNEQGFGFDQGQ
jgi:hypothetical protein